MVDSCTINEAQAMTVNTTNITSGPYTGNGTSDTFSYTFRIVNKAQVSVYETDDNGVQNLLTVDTDYTVAGLGDDGGGTITRVAGALPVDYEWFIRSNYQETQLTAFQSQGPYFPDLHENVADKLTFLIQQLRDSINRSLRISDTEGGGSFVIEARGSERANAVVSFDSDGNVLLRFINDFQFSGTRVEDQTATQGQTTFTLSGFSYTPNLNNLSVYINGVRQASDAYSETSSSVVTFSEGLDAGDKVTFLVNERQVEAGQVASTSVIVTGGNNLQQYLDTLTPNSLNPWSVQSAGFTAAANSSYFVDTTSAAVTATLPASPVLGDSVTISDLVNNFGTNNCILNRNGNLIEGSASNLTLSTDGQTTRLVYSGATYGWQTV